MGVRCGLDGVELGCALGSLELPYVRPVWIEGEGALCAVGCGGKFEAIVSLLVGFDALFAAIGLEADSLLLARKKCSTLCLFDHSHLGYFHVERRRALLRHARGRRDVLG